MIFICWGGGGGGGGGGKYYYGAPTPQQNKYTDIHVSIFVKELYGIYLLTVWGPNEGQTALCSVPCI